MLFLYKIQPARPEILSMGATAAEEHIIAQHFDYLKELTRAGVVFMAGRTLNSDPSSFGIVIFNTDSQVAARQIMEIDPAVRQGVFMAELFPFRIALLGNQKEP